jgi:hypothetical protein
MSATMGQDVSELSRSANRSMPPGVRRAISHDAVDRRANEDGGGEPYDPVAPQPRLVRATDRAPSVAPVVPRRGGSEKATTPAEPEVVRVHIGRVEVRAIIAPPPERQRNTPPAPDASRALSLEKYLEDKGRL